jgi:hypothetical protein
LRIKPANDFIGPLDNSRNNFGIDRSLLTNSTANLSEVGGCLFLGFGVHIAQFRPISAFPQGEFDSDTIAASAVYAPTGAGSQ